MYHMVIDTETGGFDPLHHSLLSVGMILCDELVRPVQPLVEHEIFLAHPYYIVTGEALAVNQIDLSAHDVRAEPIAEADRRLSVWLENISHTPCIPVGWNVRFDLSFLKIQMPLTYKRLSYHPFDVETINLLAVIHGKSITGSLRRVADHLGVPPETTHQALADAHTTLAVLDALRTRLGV